MTEDVGSRLKITAEEDGKREFIEGCNRVVAAVEALTAALERLADKSLTVTIKPSDLAAGAQKGNAARYARGVGGGPRAE
jgi:hypothetical protein